MPGGADEPAGRLRSVDINFIMARLPFPLKHSNVVVRSRRAGIHLPAKQFESEP
jgi:hypothetical protein